jgi:Family of unknown function (DUF6492)
MQTLSVVLPVAVASTYADARDGLRARLLLTSFCSYFDFKGLDKFVVLCPPQDIAHLEALVAHATPDTRFKVLPETAVAPELVRNHDTVRNWFKQQLLKLAAAFIVDTEFYLVFDSDIICMRPFSADDLIVGGRARCNRETALDYLKLYRWKFARAELECKHQRVVHASRLIGLRRPVRYWGQYYGETPVLLHTQSIRNMARHIEQRFHMNWRTALLTHLPWTEYTLYFQYLEARGDLDRYHSFGGRNSVLMLDYSVWQASEWYRMPRPRDEFWQRLHSASHGPGFFVALQTYVDPMDWLPTNIRTTEHMYSALLDWIPSQTRTDSFLRATRTPPYS